MKKKQMSRNVRRVQKYEYSKIERIYANLGFVWIIGKDGSKKSWTVHEAALIARQLNAGLPEEPSARKVVYKLIEDVIQAIREAQYQQELPPNTDTAAVTKAVVSSEIRMAMQLDRRVYLKIKSLQAIYAMLDFDEIRVVIERETWSDKFKTDFLNAANKERLAVFMSSQGRMLTAPF